MAAIVAAVDKKKYLKLNIGYLILGLSNSFSVKIMAIVEAQHIIPISIIVFAGDVSGLTLLRYDSAAVSTSSVLVHILHHTKPTKIAFEIIPSIVTKIFISCFSTY
jgi:hypothetical protein